MKEWWTKLALRERLITTSTAILLGILLVYTFIWHPMSSGIAQLEQSTLENRTTKQWMEQAAVEAQNLRATDDPATKGPDNRSLLALVDETSKQAGLGSAIKHIEPENQEIVRVTLEQATFDDLVMWLGSLQHLYRIQVTELAVDREGDGIVGAHITLRKASV
jgi:general secretion pathway protein M